MTGGDRETLAHLHDGEVPADSAGALRGERQILMCHGVHVITEDGVDVHPGR
jgi:hypothetical protein